MARVTLKMDSTQKILMKRNLEKNGKAQRFFTSEVRRLCDPYVPMDTGTLKNTAIENTDNIVYQQVYSNRQYTENRGNGLRGKLWDVRMWADRGNEIVQSVANFVGGRTK